MKDLQAQLKQIVESRDDRPLQAMHIEAFIKDFIARGEYYAVCPYTEDISKMRQFVGLFQGQTPCYYVFTDKDIAIGFAKHYGLSSATGDVLYITLNTKHFLETLSNLRDRGVQLVIFDEGAHMLCHNIQYFIELINK